MSKQKQENKNPLEIQTGIKTQTIGTISSEGIPVEMRDLIDSALEPLNHLISFDACALLLINNGDLAITTCKGFPNSRKLGRLRFSLADFPQIRNLINQKFPLRQSNGIAGILLDTSALPFKNTACLQIPLLSRNQPIGLLVLYQFNGKDIYSEKDAEAAMVFAKQAALAIENARLFMEARQKAIQLEVAGQVVKKVSSILNLEVLLSEIVRLIRVKFGYYHVHIFLVDERSNQIILQEISGEKHESLRKSGLRLDIGGNSITGWVAASREALLCNDVSQEARYHPHELLPSTKSELALPLQIGKKLVGVLDIQSDKLNRFRDDDLTILQIVAGQVAIAIENAYLFQRSQDQVGILSALHKISLRITSKLETEQVLETIMRQAVKLLKAQGSSLGIYDADKNVIRKISSYNVPLELKGMEFAVGEGVAGQVIATRKPVFTNDYESWHGRSSKFNTPPYNAVLGVPLFWEEQVIGELVVLDRTERRTFTSDDANLLSFVADLASIALKNSELYDEVRKSREELEQKVIQRTSQLSEAQEALTQKAEELRRLLEITVIVQEEERARIALDLHDGTNQLITGTLYEIQAAQQSIHDHRWESSIEKLETAKRLLRTIEAENRKIITGLRPIILDTDGLLAALRWYAETFQKDFGINCSLRVIGKPVQFLQPVETAIYRIVQESLNNTVKHSQATNVYILADFGTEGFHLVIADDGVGFDLGSGIDIKKTQMGLFGMKERAQSINGKLVVQSQPGQGTQISLEIPIYPAPGVELT